MKVGYPIDIEEEIRVMLENEIPTVKTYVRPLPAHPELPNVLITSVGISTVNYIDTFDISIDVRAENEENASLIGRVVAAAIEACAKLGESSRYATCQGVKYPIRSASIISGGSWGTDPVRPDLALYGIRMRVTAHRDTRKY